MLDEPGYKPKSSKNNEIDLLNHHIAGNDDLVRQILEENRALREENAVLELNQITKKMTIKPVDLDYILNSSTHSINSFDNQLVVPIQRQIGESHLHVENRLLKVEIEKLQYVSRIWERYTQELGILQKENDLLKEAVSRFKAASQRSCPSNEVPVASLSEHTVTDRNLNSILKQTV